MRLQLDFRGPCRPGPSGLTGWLLIRIEYTGQGEIVASLLNNLPWLPWPTQCGPKPGQAFRAPACPLAPYRAPPLPQAGMPTTSQHRSLFHRQAFAPAISLP